MTTESIIVRFEGQEGRRRLMELLRKQVITGGDSTIASEIAAVATLEELSPRDILIHQDAADNDLFLILSGTFRVVINGRDVALRGPGQHVGEMAIIDSSSPRAATVIAAERSIVAKIPEAEFVRIADTHSYVWRSLTTELCHRLNERKRFHPEPNVKPIVFIGSSKEQLPIAEAIAATIPPQIADVILWSKDVFEPSHFVIDDLDAQLRSADFAVLVAGTDDQITSRGSQSDAPRDNVVFELGLFMGALSRYRTFLFVPKGTKLKIPSDLLGLTCIVYDDSATNPAVAVKTAVQELTAVIAEKGPK